MIAGRSGSADHMVAEPQHDRNQAHLHDLAIGVCRLCACAEEPALLRKEASLLCTVEFWRQMYHVLAPNLPTFGGKSSQLGAKTPAYTNGVNAVHRRAKRLTPAGATPYTYEETPPDGFPDAAAPIENAIAPEQLEWRHAPGTRHLRREAGSAIIVAKRRGLYLLRRALR